MQLRHVPQFDRTRQLVADFRCQCLQCLDGFVGPIGLQYGNKHLGMRHIPRHFDIGHTGGRQPMLAHGRMHQGTQLTSELGRYAIGAME